MSTETVIPPVPIEDVVSPACAQAAERAQTGGRPILASVGVPVPDADPLALPLAGKHMMGGWWAREGFTAAGIDVAFTAQASGAARFEDLTASLRSWFEGAAIVGRAPIAFAGGAFIDTAPEDAWAELPAAAAWIPEVCAIRDADGMWLVASTPVLAGEAEAAADHLATVFAQAAQALTAQPGAVESIDVAPERGTFTPGEEGWTKAVERALGEITFGELRKVVLARRLQLPVRPDPWRTAAGLAARYPECFGYGISFGDTSMVGASPELLVSLEGDAVRSAPAAGTVARDARRGLDTDKSRREEEIVVDAVVETLRPYCSDVRAGEPQAADAGPVRHLRSSVTGRLDEPKHILELVDALHPTPAVGGSPTKAALEFLRQAEGFDRGWYAGPMGIVTPEGGGEFSPALRGALIHPSGTDLYAGAGIVEGSVPNEERSEVALKLRTAAEALG